MSGERAYPLEPEGERQFPPEAAVEIVPEPSQAAGAIRKMLIPLALGQFLCSYANAALNVSISDIAKDLGTTVTGVQTSITLFTLVMAALMITGSKVTDIWGRKRTFLLGIMVFAVGATVAAFAPAMGVMVLGYSIGQGIASALLIPPVYILTTVAIEDVKVRAAAFGLIGGAGAVASGVGPLVGGILTTGISWRATFLSEALLAIVILFLSRSIIDVPFTGEKPKLDIPGALLSAAGMAFVIYGILQAGDYGWLRARQDVTIGNVTLIQQGGISPVVILVGIGVLVLWLFIRHMQTYEREGKEPLVHVHVLKNHVTNLGLLTQNFQWFVLLGTSFVVSVYLQAARAHTAIETGLILTPATIGVLIASWRVGTMVKKYPLRRILVVGFGLAAIGIGLVVFAGMNIPNDWALAPGLLLFGFGMGAALPASVNLVQSSMPEKDQGEISGVSRSVSNLGSSMGTAVAGAVMVSVLITAVTSLTYESTVLPPAAKDQIAVALQGDVSILSDAQIQTALAGQPPEIVNEVLRINELARDRALGLAELVLGLVAVLGLLVSLRLPKEPSPAPVAADGGRSA
jgi:MFS family permease